LKKSRVFVFNDLENWWTRSDKGNESIDYLAKLIEKVGDKHFFILNCNKHSYQILKQTTNIEKQLLSTIIMRPVSRIQLKDIILNRHKIGGAEIYYQSDLVQDSNKITDLINEIHSLSSGNIGVGLHLWLTSIHLSEDSELYIEKPDKDQFPNIKNPNWKLLLYQFIIHRKLSNQQLKEIFYKNNAWVKSSLNEMEKADLVLKQPNGKYRLNFRARHYIENWLQTLSILN